MKQLFFTLVCLLVACSKPAPTPAPVASDPKPVVPIAPSTPKGMTGVLSEEEFKKLHELKQDSAPPRTGKMIEIGGARAYLSLPAEAKTPLPGVIVIHEWWGLNEHVKHWTDRLAADGYATLAVDLYGGKVATNPDEAMKAMKAVDEKAARATLLEAHEFLKTDSRVLATKRGVMGWCFGGKWSLELALSAPDVDATVVYYGHVTTDAKELAKLKAPLYGVFGNKDQGIPPSMVDAFETSLKANKAKFSIKRYDAEHAFANPSNPRYDQKSAEDAWKNVREFLAAELKGKQP